VPRTLTHSAIGLASARAGTLAHPGGEPGGTWTMPSARRGRQPHRPPSCLVPDDDCFFLREYTAGAGYKHGETTT
jgi:hypothetical protein